MKVNFALIVLLIYAILTTSLSVIKHSHDYETIKYIERRHQHYRDSIDQVMKLKNDSLEIAFTTIRIQSERIRSTEQQVIKLQKRHENIPFVTHRTDSARVRSLSELYPSYGKD